MKKTLQLLKFDIIEDVPAEEMRPAEVKKCIYFKREDDIGHWLYREDRDGIIYVHENIESCIPITQYLAKYHEDYAVSFIDYKDPVTEARLGWGWKSQLLIDFHDPFDGQLDSEINIVMKHAEINRMIEEAESREPLIKEIRNKIQELEALAKEHEEAEANLKYKIHELTAPMSYAGTTND